MTSLFLRIMAMRRRACAALCIALLCCLHAVSAAARPPMRLIYMESGPLDEYRQTLQGIAEELHRERFLTITPPAMSGKYDAREIWRWLGEHSDGRLQFLQDGFYSAQWDDNAQKEVRQAVQRRLETRRDVDAILVLGTRVGKDMATLPASVPIIVASVTDAVEAGIVPSVADSGKDNLVALVNPQRYQRQVEFFHGIFHFRRLGVVYEDTPTGRNVVALKEIEAAAAAVGAELVRCHTQLHDSDADTVADSVKTCHRKLVEQQTDAVYLTVNVAMTPEQTRRTLDPLIAAGVPTFAQSGISIVKNGALISFVDDSIEEGRHAARILGCVRDGTPPRALPQLFRSPQRLAINLRTAARTGWNPSVDVLLSVDDFYE